MLTKQLLILLVFTVFTYLGPGCNSVTEKNSNVISGNNPQHLAEINNEEDSRFLIKVARAGLMEIELGKLAQQYASSPKVKEYGGSMVSDHDKIREEIKELAVKKHIILPQNPVRDDLEKIEELKKKKGVEFDKAYMQMIVLDHQQDIEMFQQEAEKGKDPEIKAFATAKISDMLQHLQVAITINNSLLEQ